MRYPPSIVVDMERTAPTQTLIHDFLNHMSQSFHAKHKQMWRQAIPLSQPSLGKETSRDPFSKSSLNTTSPFFFFDLDMLWMISFKTIALSEVPLLGIKLLLCRGFTNLCRRGLILLTRTFFVIL